MKRKFFLPAAMLALFEAVAVTLWISSGNIFYLFNFSYIGLSVSLAVFLFAVNFVHARRVSQILVGLYMMAWLGLARGENMQIEGFWYYLFTGVFEAATIHYAVAKIFGPLIFGRGWCGYACWTAMVLDFLPHRIPQNHRRRKIGWISCVAFASSLAFVALLFLTRAREIRRIMFWSFVAGNLVYYIAGIALAFALKDNRAFCKYACPVALFMRIPARFSLLRIRCDKEKCVSCGACRKACPMDVDMTDNSRSRENGCECILCFECTRICPRSALR